LDGQLEIEVIFCDVVNNATFKLIQNRHDHWFYFIAEQTPHLTADDIWRKAIHDRAEAEKFY
jgi:hypothetical protein